MTDCMERAREVAAAILSDDAWFEGEEMDVGTDTESAATRIAAALKEAVEQERERCARIADEYADVNREAAGDTVLLDPCLRGDGFTRENIARSGDMAVDGCVYSAKAHAATELARFIRAAPATECG